MLQLCPSLKNFFTNILLQLNSHLPHLYSIRRPKFWPCLLEMFMVPHYFPSYDTPFFIDRVSPAHTLSHLPVETRGGPGENNGRACTGAVPGRQEFWGESVLVGGYHIWKKSNKSEVKLFCLRSRFPQIPLITVLTFY